MRSESFLKASWWLSLRSFARGLLSFYLWWGCSSGETFRLATSSSSGLEAVASWLDNWSCCLVPVGGAGILDIVAGEAVNGGSLPVVASCGVIAIMASSGTLPVRSTRGYISTPWASRGQACKAVPQASTNAWQSHPSCASASHSSLSTLSSWDCSKSWAWVAWQISASLIAILWQVSVSLIAASASLMVVHIGLLPLWQPWQPGFHFGSW